MKLRRIANPKGWTSIPTKAISDDALTFRALGVLAYLLSRPDGWETDSVRLSTPGRREGRDATRTALAELEKAGYLHRVKVRRPAGMTLDGRYVGGQISTEYFVSDHPTEHAAEVLELVDTLEPDPPADAGAWESGAGEKNGDNSVENAGDNYTPAPGKPAPENPAPLTSTKDQLDQEAQRNHRPVASLPVEKVTGLPAGAPPRMLAALAEKDAPVVAALTSTLAIERAARLEPRVQMFALRAHLADALGTQPSFAVVYGWVERAHESCRPIKRGRLTTGELVAYVVSYASMPEPESSRSAASPPGGLPAAEPASRPAGLGGTERAILAGTAPTRPGGLGG